MSIKLQGNNKSHIYLSIIALFFLGLIVFSNPFKSTHAAALTNSLSDRVQLEKILPPAIAADAAFVASQFLGNSSTEGIALGDLDGDGDLDAFAVNDSQPDKIWVNQGGAQNGTPGSFIDSGQNFGTARGWSVDLGDLDGDGDLDAFVGNGGGGTNLPNTVWMNQGGAQAGTEGLFADSGQNLGSSASYTLKLGDLDGDGDLDAFVGNRTNGSGQPNKVWLNDGSGNFTDSGQNLGNEVTTSLALGDLDADGDLDAFTANSFGQQNKIWLNDGNGLFSVNGQTTANVSSTGVDLGDLDGDGDLDAYVANAGSNRIWLNDGAGLFIDSGQFLGSASSSNDVDLGDLDGDGDLDAFVIHESFNGHIIWINQGGAQAGLEGIFLDGGLSLGNSSSHGFQLGDLDSDGDLDAFVGNQISAANIVWQNQGGPLAESNQFFGNSPSREVDLGDIDGDGDADAILAKDGGNEIWINQGGIQAGTLGLFLDSGQRLGSNDSRAVRFADFDGDSDLDLAVANADFAAQIWFNDGSGNFTNSGQSLSATGGISLVIGNIDGDGDIDFLIGYSSLLRVFKNNGSGIFSNPQSIAGFSPYDIALGDLDGDTDLDAFVANNSTSAGNKVLTNDGTGTFILTGQNLGSAFSRGVALGDLDGDSDLDAFVTNILFPNGNQIYINQGGAQGGTEGVFADSGQLLGNSWSEDVTLGDIDGDLDLDAFVSNGNNQPNKVWLNNGSGTFSDSGQSLSNRNSIGHAMADLDNDTDLDIFVANYENEDHLWLNNGTGTFTDSGQLISSDSWGTSGAVGDLDGDGDLDIFVGNSHNSSTSPNHVLINQGGLQAGLTGSFLDSGQNLGNGGTLGVALGDLDGDNDLDAFIANGTFIGGPDKVWLNDGNGNFIDSGQALSNNTSTSVALGDIDGDSDLDAVVGNKNGQATKIWLNDGNGNFTDSGQALDNGLITNDVGLGDLDGDGDLDAFLTNSANAPNSVWINQGNAQNGTLGIFLSSGQSLGNSNSNAVQLADFDGDTDLDAFVANNSHANKLWINSGGAQGGTAGIFIDSGLAQDNDYAKDVAAADFDGDGDLDLFIGTENTTSNAPNYHWVNNGAAQGGTLGTFNSNNSAVGNTLTHAALVGDLDNDGDLDLFLINYGAENQIISNGYQNNNRFANNGPAVKISRPLNHPQVNGYVPFPEISSSLIPISYTLFDFESDPVGRIELYYSVDGGGQWNPAVPTTNTVMSNLATAPWPLETAVNSHTFIWDTFASGFFGQSDNVIIRIHAYPQPTPLAVGNSFFYTNTAPTTYQMPLAQATTLPFRLRGTQIRVYSDTITLGNEAANAIVYRIPAGQIAANPITDLNSIVYTTDTDGFLQGRGELGIGDQLIALLPILSEESYTLYFSSAAVTNTGIIADQVDQSGIQNLLVSANNPLILFNLSISLEWDAQNDTAYLQQLTEDIERASELLYDSSNGQIAIGDVTIYHGKENWTGAHILIHAANNIRPSAAMGGVVSSPINEVITATQIITDAYLPGQVRMGPIWSRFGDPSANLGEDWPRALAHELGHLLLFLPDNYLGLDGSGNIVPTDCYGSMMTNAYTDEYSELLTATEWVGPCLQTVAENSTGRTDWETVTRFYPWLNQPATPLTGPTSQQLAVTRIQFIPPASSENILPAPFFSLRTPANEQIFIQNGQGSGYLFKNVETPQLEDDYLLSLGSPVGDQIHARGAATGDRLCVFDQSDPLLQLGCLDVGITEGNITLYPLPGWSPQIQTAVLTATLTDTSLFSNTLALAITLTQHVPTGTVYAQVIPATGISETFPIIGASAQLLPVDGTNMTFTQLITLPYPTMQGFVRVWVAGASPAQETILPFYLGDGWGGNRASWGGNRAAWGGNRAAWGGNRASWGAPVASGDGQVIIFNFDDIFADTGTNSLQALITPPPTPAWLTPVGQVYRFEASSPLTRTIAFNYLQSDVPGGNTYENLLTLYYSADEGKNWQRLQTSLDTEDNLATTKMPLTQNGNGLYALISTVPIGPFATGWNNFGYPIPTSRTVTETMASISGKFSSLYHYDAFGGSWLLNDEPVKSEHPQFVPLINDLKMMDFTKAYWVYATEPITLYIKSPGNGGSINPLATTAGLQLPPTTYYGWVTPTAVFTPTLGMAVTASVDGTVCGTATIVQLNGQLAYKVQAESENLLPPANNCGDLGETVVFTVGSWTMDHERNWDNQQAWYNDLTCVVPQIPTVSINESGTDVQLNWLEAFGENYEVWFELDNPYFTPGLDCGVAANCTAASTLSYTDLGALGNPANNVYYKIIAANSCATRSIPGNHVAEFDFTITPGS